VSVRDNGTGIAEEMKEKIFVPNFTTKTTGTGLGLAMVKNIIASYGGKIWFVSKAEEGTTFYLTFQK
jgi:signal transduction histidine kinase